ncbi:hypothetical protein VTK56DRAFT_8178 [Thermocarpiscus australiensis]
MSEPGRDPALDNESRTTEIIAILTVASILSTLVVALRTYCRGFLLRSFGWDDGVMLPAQVLVLASAVAIGLEAKYGLGRHAWTMPAENYIPYMKAFYSSIVVYNVAVCLTKMSILLQYRRIFGSTPLAKVIKFALCFFICWGITLCFLLPLVCIPVAAFWDENVHGFCLDNGTIWYVMAGVNVVTDFTIFVMPIPVIGSLHLPRRQKAMLLIVFTLGIFPCAVSIYRIHTLHAAAQSLDPTWDNVDAATFSFLELTVGVIAICLPTLRPILVHAMPRLFDSLRSKGPSANGPGTNDPRSRRSHGPGKRGSAYANGSLFAGRTLKESDSTEGLRLDEPPRSRLENDIEFGELDVPGRAKANGGGYEVTVVGGWDGHRDSGVGETTGIKATTVVTQDVQTRD